MIATHPLHEFVKDVTVWTIGADQDGVSEAFVTKPYPVACPTCDTAHALFIVHDGSYSCLICAGRVR